MKLPIVFKSANSLRKLGVDGKSHAAGQASSGD